jgi:hypothetical protein
MFEGIPGLVSYVLLKLGGYSAWSHLGLRWFDPKRRSDVLGALGRGVARLALGWLTGILVAPLALVAAGTGHVPLFYFTALAGVRWLEWGLLQLSFPVPAKGLATLVHGGTRRARVWRLGGILVSYLADAPFLIASDGFPHGRLFC